MRNLGFWGVALLVMFVGVAEASPGTKQLTIDTIFDPKAQVNFSGDVPMGMIWIDAGHYVWPQKSADKSITWMKVDAKSGDSSAWFDAQALKKAFVALSVSKEDAQRVANQNSLTLNKDKTAFVATIANDLYVYNLTTQKAQRITASPGEKEFPAFSPDGTQIAFVRNHNLFVVDLQSQKEVALTTDGNSQLFNGKLDWIYQEEVYGRDIYQAFWWSPDSTHIAFLQLNEQGVPHYTIIDDIPADAQVESYPYPKAGDQNPKARLGVVAVEGGPVRWVDDARYKKVDTILVNVAWSPDSKAVVYQVQDRAQKWLDLNRFTLEGGGTQRYFREQNKTWVERLENPFWLSDGSFLWLSDRSGFIHLYHYNKNGKLIRQLTKGAFNVKSVYAVDDAHQRAFISAKERSPLSADIYELDLNIPTTLTRLSQKEGSHTALFNSDQSLYLDTWSDITTPPQLSLHDSAGHLVRIVQANTVAALQDYALSKPEFMQVKTKDGFVMEAMMIKPPNFDPTRKYPVIYDLYAGPTWQNVQNTWQGKSYMFLQLLAQKGFVIWQCDNRSASGKGPQAIWPIYREFGKLELSDISDAVAWLKSQPFVDASKIAVWGWSFGGYMVVYAMTHSKLFAAGIAGGTVADWRDYDSMYTERYMDTPQNNPEGYAKSSVTSVAQNLSGHLLLVQGALDDNVHMQNTMQLIYALQNAQKRFELMIYPKSKHGVKEPLLLKHFQQLRLDFVLSKLGIAD